MFSAAASYWLSFEMSAKSTVSSFSSKLSCWRGSNKQHYVVRPLGTTESVNIQSQMINWTDYFWLCLPTAEQCSHAVIIVTSLSIALCQCWLSSLSGLSARCNIKRIVPRHRSIFGKTFSVYGQCVDRKTMFFFSMSPLWQASDWPMWPYSGGYIATCWQQSAFVFLYRWCG